MGGPKKPRNPTRCTIIAKRMIGSWMKMMMMIILEHRSA